MAETHANRMSSIRQEIDRCQDELNKSQAPFQKKMKNYRSQYQSSIDEATRSYRCEAEKWAQEWIEIKNFLEEKIAVLTRRRDDMIEAFRQRPPRQSELDIIGPLDELLQAKTAQLQNALVEMQEYRELRQRQEDDTAHRFGKSRIVGIFPMVPKTSH
jgi:hypothetical protein